MTNTIPGPEELWLMARDAAELKQMAAALREVVRDTTGMFNMIILQWFGMHLAECRTTSTERLLVGLVLIAPVLPLTGWFGEYVPDNPLVLVTLDPQGLRVSQRTPMSRVDKIAVNR